MEDDNTAPTSATHREASDDEHDSKEKVLQKYFLQEWPLLNSLLDRIVSDHAVSDPSDVHTIRSIIDKYQEQGQLLEPYLETIIAPLMSIIRSQTLNLGVSSDGDDDVLKIAKPLCIIVYALVTVCGYKNVVRFFPHQVSDLELAVCLLDKCHYGASGTYLRQESTGEMETKCVVLLWLYILVLIPFDMSSVDTSLAECGAEGGMGPPPLVLKIIGLAKDYLSSAGPMRRISGLLLSRLLTRPDMKDAFTSFCEWAHDTLLPVADNSVDRFILLGILEALASTFKVGGRDILVNAVATIWNDIKVLSKSSNASHSSLIRKFIMKLSQRIGLACLPHRSSSLHYLVKKISLDACTKPVFHGDMVNIENHEEVEDDIDIPEITEEIIEQLLSGLRDMDTVVRWSAAKGVGRITARLTYPLLEDVLSSILELFSPGEGDGSWHGGCLALAELARRGLLLPSSLPKVVPVIVKALHYDIRRGPHSVGSHVRDAAAYVCWAFGRAYSLADMRATLDQLAPHLLRVACYDREVNCRRAAAAAFQENVGRQGSFPNGIYIVNTADYFSLSSRTNSYLNVAACISQFKEYLCPFAEELIYHKVPHWDKSLRELAAVALAALVKYKPEYFAEDVLNTLTPQTLSSDLCMRHGATLAVGELVLSLHKCGFTLSAEKQKSVSNIVPAIEDARLYRGKGGEIMRSCVSRFIECISLACVTLTEKSKKKLLNTLNENLKHPNAQIQHCAVDALRSFLPTYVGLDDELSKTLTSRYLELLKDPNAAARRGSALAIGSLPFEYLAPRWRDVMPKLCMSCTIQERSDDLDAEARVNAVYGLASVCETLTSKNDPVFDNVEEEYSLYLEIKTQVVHTLLRCLDDYAVDNRGDVGSWVREAAINGLVKCTKILCRKDSISLVEPLSLVASVCNTFTTKIPYLFCEDLASSIIGGIAKQAVEKLDKLRGIAARALQTILYDQECIVSSITHIEALKEIIPNKIEFKWEVPKVSFPCLVKLLEFDCYSKAVLSGMVISVGGLQDSLRKASLSALLDHIQHSEIDAHGGKNTREYRLSLDFLWILKHYQRKDRVIVPTLKTIEILFGNKVFLNMENIFVEFHVGVLDALVIELKATKDFSKLFIGLSLLGYVASASQSINARGFSLLLSFLGHRYPKIRKACADQVYLVILQNENLMEPDKTEGLLEIITETCWEGDLAEVKRQKSHVYALTGIKCETVAVAPKIDIAKSTSNDENLSYSSLVGFSGL